MTATNAQPPAALAAIEREYAFARDQWAAYSRENFDDFKLYAALGTVVGWSPVVGLLSKDCTKTDITPYLLVGFATMAVVAAIVMMREFLRQSVTVFYLNRMTDLEERLAAASGGSTAATGNEWRNWAQRSHKFIAFAYYALFVVALVFGPAAILYWLGYKAGAGTGYAGGYLTVALVALILPVFAFRRLYKRYVSRIETGDNKQADGGQDRG